jgi:hypothetical protein
LFNIDPDQMVNFLNKSELSVEDNMVLKSRGHLNYNDGILNLNTEKLYKEYCTNNFNENSLMKYEYMLNDFKIILKLIESFKNDVNYENKEQLNKNLIDL